MRFAHHIFVFFLTLAFVHSFSGGRSSGGRGARHESGRLGTYGARYAQQYPGQQAKETSSNYSAENPPERRTTRGGLGISAWGLVALIISVVVCSMGAYYFIIFYPLLCKKERNYDVIEVSTV